MNIHNLFTKLENANQMLDVYNQHLSLEMKICYIPKTEIQKLAKDEFYEPCSTNYGNYMDEFQMIDYIASNFSSFFVVEFEKANFIFSKNKKYLYATLNYTLDEEKYCMRIQLNLKGFKNYE